MDGKSGPDARPSIKRAMTAPTKPPLTTKTGNKSVKVALMAQLNRMTVKWPCFCATTEPGNIDKQYPQ